MIWRLLLTVVLLTAGLLRCQGQTATSTVEYTSTTGDVTDARSTENPTTTTTAEVTTTLQPTTTTTTITTTKQPTTSLKTTTQMATTLMYREPSEDLIAEGGVEVELEAVLSTTATEIFDEDEFRKVMAEYANIWCTEDPDNCETADPLMVHANDVVVYETSDCSDTDYDCVDDGNIVVGFYITKPSASHEVLMTSESLEAMLRTYEEEIEADLGYGIVPPKEVEEEEDSSGLEPWVIALICFLILCVIVLIIILVVRNRRQKRLANMPKEEFDLVLNGTGASPVPGHGKQKKDESTLVYQAWILRAMQEDEIGTQVRSADILRAMKEDDVGTQVRTADIVNEMKKAPLVTHVDETKDHSPSSARASIQSGSSSDDDNNMVPPEYEKIIDPGPSKVQKEPEPQAAVTVSVTATKDAPGKDPSASVTVTATKTVTDPPPPPPPPATEPPLDDTLPPPPEMEALQEFDKLIDNNDSPVPAAAYDNPAYEVINHETGTGLQDGSLVTAL
ncbi:uncharacterized protein LOC102804516 [Saccoglossus kowalevskii]|uniref:Uncharacterized protein LOC102804516 n=1 Tax=Saccoglossus kowalevskii TaxID=10224 RepID=A0ABM0M842_SACKO|nr:PREDICTED: uncharacterized protein LOC102804516 [Saccoglossus kowalevskii]